MKKGNHSRNQTDLLYKSMAVQNDISTALKLIVDGGKPSSRNVSEFKMALAPGTQTAKAIGAGHTRNHHQRTKTAAQVQEVKHLDVKLGMADRMQQRPNKKHQAQKSTLTGY